MKTPEIYGKCLGKIASFNSDLSLCKNENDTIVSDECFFEYARGQRNVSICNYIQNNNKKENCIHLVQEIIWDVGTR